MIVLGEDYEHVQSLASTECGGITYEVRKLGELYRLILAHGDFDVSEFSLSNHAMFRDQGDNWLSAIPIFPSRSFRHSTIIVKHDSPLDEFKHLVGKRVGIVDYSMTAAVWTRGHMLDDYGVHWSDINWVSGLKPRFPTPEGVRMSHTGDGLEELLTSGELDALLAPHPRDFKNPPSKRQFRCLLRNVSQVEENYFRRTGIFPIMHTVILRDHVIRQWPDAPRVLYDLFEGAKQRGLQRRLATTFMPWLDREWDRVDEIVGGDPHPYGLTPQNLRTIETLGRYLLEQRLIKAPIDIDNLFVSDAKNWPGG